jgi:methylenetetrahydrofolate dehydrogenase (NADP+) / methenyltetrahydrofolate cyclohydrolase
METKILKGELTKERILTETKTEIAELKRKHNKVPGIVFIGFNGVPLAKYSIPLHVHLATELGFKVVTEMKSETVTEEELFALIDSLNNDDSINAIVILQPMPAHLNAFRILNRIDPDKEVEGFHPKNLMGTILPEAHNNKYPMCLPAALIEIFREDNIEIKKDQEFVFLVDDDFFSNPLTNMIVRASSIKVVPEDCSLTYVNKNSEKCIAHCKRADYLIVVTKYPEYVKPEWLKPGVCIIDIYSNLVKEVPAKNNPEKFVPVIRGGVNVDSVMNIAGMLLPIPGGLMTVVLTILLNNAMISFKNSVTK